jgi:multiple antibiotic resistance protein
MPDAGVPLSVLAPLLFTLMGPIAAMPLFAAATAGAERPLQRRIAIKAYLVALITLAIAVFVGSGVLSGWGVERASLIMAAGLILTITALRSIFGSGHGGADAAKAAPTEALAISPIAIPGLVTPMSVAVLVIFVSYFPATSDKLAVMAVAAMVMTLNLGAMLGANWFMRVVGPSPLVVLGGVFGVLQAAMGIDMIVNGVLLSPLWV